MKTKSSHSLMNSAVPKSLLGAVLATLLMGGAASTTVSAAETAVFNASMCVRVSGPMFRHNWGSIYNPSNTTATRVTCPVVTTFGQLIDNATIRVTDRNADNRQHVTCELVIVARNSNTSAPRFSRTGRKSSTGFGSDLEFSRSDFSPAQSIPDIDSATKSFNCTIPPQAGTGPSYIHHYKVQFGS